MRLHCDYSHPDWSALAAFAHVFLDGVEQKFVIYADEEHGAVQRYAVEKDNPNKPQKQGELLVIETIMGKVEIQFKGIDPGQACLHIADRARQLIEEAKRIGVVLTVEQIPLKPLRMGHYDTVASVRPVRKPA